MVITNRIISIIIISTIITIIKAITITMLSVIDQISDTPARRHLMSGDRDGSEQESKKRCMLAIFSSRFEEAAICIARM